MPVPSRLRRNVAANLAGQSLLLVIGVVAVRLVFVRLGDDALGLVYFTLTLATVLGGALDLGITSTTVRQVAGHASREPRYVQELLRTAAAFYWLAWAGLSILLWAAAPLLVGRWVNLTSLNAETAVAALRVLGIGALTGVPRSLYVSLFGGLERMAVSNAVEVGIGAVQQAGTIAVLAAGGGLIAVAVWLSACYAAGIAVYLVLAGRAVGARALRPRFSAAVVTRNRRFSAGMTWVSLLAMVHTQADKVIVSRLLPLGTFGVWGVAVGLVSRVSLLTGAVAQAALPSLSALFHRGDRPRLLVQYRLLHDLLCFGAVPVFAALMLAAGPLLAALFDSDIAAGLAGPVMLLCVGYYMNATLTVPYVVTLAVGRPGIAVRANALALVAVLPLTALLIWTQGLLGAGLAWVVYHAFMYAYGVPRVCAECLHVSARRWYAHVGAIAALAAATYGLAGVLAVVAAPHGGLAARGLAWTVASLAFAAGALRLMGPEARAALTRSRPVPGAVAPIEAGEIR